MVSDRKAKQLRGGRKADAISMPDSPVYHQSKQLTIVSTDAKLLDLLDEVGAADEADDDLLSECLQEVEHLL